jgi:hypothetical protein
LDWSEVIEGPTYFSIFWLVLLTRSVMLHHTTMSRLFTYDETRQVPPPPAPFIGRGGLAKAGEAEEAQVGKTKNEGKDYLELLLKMIPGEVVSLYTFAINIVPLIGISAARPAIAWGLFGLGIVLTPWLLSLQEPKPTDQSWQRAWKWRLGLAVGAFPLWAYATTGEKLPGMPYDTIIGLIVVGVYAVVAGGIARSVAPKLPPTKLPPTK